MKSNRSASIRNTLTRISAVALLLAAVPVAPSAVAPSLAEDGAAQNCFGPAPYNCYAIGDVNPALLTGSYDTVYQAYAEFAWQDFLALNFPALRLPEHKFFPQPEPSPTNGLNYNGGDYTAVWETYVEARELFLPDGATPAAFGSGHPIPDICLQAAAKEGKDEVFMVASRISKVQSATGSAEVLDEYIQANRMGPVVDQNGNYARFAINFNEDIYDYVVDNTLYTPEGQSAFDPDDPDRNKSPVQWPRGAYTTAVQESSIGSVMVKAAWKIFEPNEDMRTHHRVLAYVYNPAGGLFGQEPEVTESCTVETLGLVGFHIVHRTNSAPGWIWSTFEHIENAPWFVDFRAGTPAGPFSFFDPGKCPSHLGHPAPNCNYNGLPDHPWNPERTDLTPSQVIRIGAPGQYAIAANAKYRNLLQQAYGVGGTVWENYFLVDVQFPTITLPGTNNVREVNPAYPDGNPTPTFLANSLIETYIQGHTPGDITTNGNVIPQGDTMENVFASGNYDVTVDPWDTSAIYSRSGGSQRNTSSCVVCHADAAMTNGTFSNYVFSLSRAQSPNPSSMPPLRVMIRSKVSSEQ